MKSRIKVLVVDDSDFVRSFLVDLLAEDDEIEVAGEARNGMEACEKVKSLKPDIVTMDIEMPEMNGMDAIERIMSNYAVPILVVTSKSDAATAYSAVSKGALEVVVKPDLSTVDSGEFIRKVKLLAGIKVITHISAATVESRESAKALSILKPSDESNKIVAIASSTGGPKALSILLSALPEFFPCPIVVAQHIPDEFIQGMTEWLDTCASIRVKTGVEGEILQSGTVYVSPSEKHMKVNRLGRIAFEDRKWNDIFFPSCNVLLKSVAEAYGGNAIGVILTGMGDDGVIGIKAIKDAGGFTIAQNEDTSVIYGMPKAAVETHCIDAVLPIDQISVKLISLNARAKAGVLAGTA